MNAEQIAAMRTKILNELEQYDATVEEIGKILGPIIGAVIVTSANPKQQLSNFIDTLSVTVNGGIRQ